ncbi:protein PFC0760c-like [Spodoptera frugiperda]|uniref:Protein PFC0760c-like n=1 Tax=Spodoptera frugiperda TaxID=7108 RepID=A0A9R0DZY9_SPOFR|nr:protein PFC0760c-like [Spodoptera frugiperda]
MNISTGNVSYTIPLEELDLSHLQKYMERSNDGPVKLWSNTQLNGDSEYCQVKIVSKEVMGKPERSYEVKIVSKEAIGNPHKSSSTQTYLCSLCNIQVPIRCHIAHKRSTQHNTYRNICNTVLQRVKNEINTENITSTEKLLDTEYYCDVCCKIIQIADKLHHETSKEHLNSMENFVILNKFNNLFSFSDNDDEDDNYVTDSDDDYNADSERVEIVHGTNDDGITKTIGIVQGGNDDAITKAIEVGHDTNDDAITKTVGIVHSNNDDSITKFNNDNDCNGDAITYIVCHNDDDETTGNKINNDCNGEITDKDNSRDSNVFEQVINSNKFYERESPKCIENNTPKVAEVKIDIDCQNFDVGNKTNGVSADNKLDIDCQNGDLEIKTNGVSADNKLDIDCQNGDLEIKTNGVSADNKIDIDCQNVDLRNESNSVSGDQSPNEFLKGIKKTADKIDDHNTKTSNQPISLKQKFIDFKKYLEQTTTNTTFKTENQENDLQKTPSAINNTELHTELNNKTENQSQNQQQKFIAATTTNQLTDIQQLDVRISPETMNFDSYLKKITNKYNLNPKIDTDGDYVVLENIKNVKFKVLQQNFHSYKVICSKIYCQLCKFWIQDFATDLNSHEMSERHVKLVLLPANENFFRELTSLNPSHERQPGHCIVCNEAVLLDSQYHITSARHKYTTNKAIIETPKNLSPTNVLCLSCNVHVPFPNYVQHLNSRRHVKTTRVQNHIFKKDTDLYTCNLCEVVLDANSIKQHMNEKGHVDKMEQMSSEREFCKTYGLKFDTSLEGKYRKFYTDTTIKKNDVNLKDIDLEYDSDDSLKVQDYKTHLKVLGKNKTVCTLCKIDLKKKEKAITKHMTSKRHIELDKMLLYNLFVKYCNDSKRIKCEICPIELPNKNKIIIDHMESELHKMYEKTLFDFHRITKYDRRYSCSYCNEHMVDVLAHIYGKDHILKLQNKNKINRDDMLRYLYNDREVNPRVLIYERLYDNFLTHNSVSKCDDNSYHCELCNKYFNRTNEIIHILGRQHFTNLYKIPPKKDKSNYETDVSKMYRAINKKAYLEMNN